MKGRVLTEDDDVPPLGDLWVYRHEAGVDIRLLVDGAACLHHNLLAEVKEGVGEGGRDGCEGEAIGDGEGCRDEEGAVCLVGLLVEGRLGGEDPGDVVFLRMVVIRRA